MLFGVLVSRSAVRYFTCAVFFLATVEACFLFSGCGRNARCTGFSLFGGGTCRCDAGWTGNPRVGCTYRRCGRVSCGRNAFCRPSGPYGSAQCFCGTGYAGFNEGATYVFNGLTYPRSIFCRETCARLQSRAPGCTGPEGRCVANSVGQGFCGCNSGYYGSPPNTLCYDVDECSRDSDDCVDNAECMNEPGSFSCDCSDGYVGIGDEQCYASCDTMSSECGVEAVCVDDPNTGGRCECPAGYSGDANEECVPGCGIIGPNCPRDSICKEDATGLGECECLPGYEGPNCVDINECDTSAPCRANGVCTNSPGSYTCTCAVGFEEDVNTGMCVDIDECTETDTLCDEHATCTNTLGGYECDCNEGYGGDGTFCEEMDDDHSSGMMDDPHIKTWDGKWFDFMGACDLVLLVAPSFREGKPLTIHVRTTIRYFYSYIEAAALNIGNDTLEVTSFGDYAFNQIGQANLTEASLAGYSVHHRTPNPKQHIFDVVIDGKENITLSTFKDLVSIKINRGDRQSFGNSFGIMGTFDGDLLERDLETTMEPGDAFGQQWQVRSYDEQLFRVVRDPQYPEACRMPTETEDKDRHNRLGQSVSKRVAEKACIHLEGAAKEGCIYDVLMVGDKDIALAY